jgi:hypothetical protein
MANFDTKDRAKAFFVFQISGAALFFCLPFLLPLSVLGILFGVVRVACKTLWCGIFVHCLHNGLTMLLMADSLGMLDGWKEALLPAF